MSKHQYDFSSDCSDSVTLAGRRLKKPKRQLYVTDWAPNGCNDLLVVDDAGTVVDCLEEATFGVSVGNRQLEGYWAFERIVPIDVPAPDGWDWVHPVRRIDLGMLDARLAVSPTRSSDEAINRVLAFLNENGVI